MTEWYNDNYRRNREKLNVLAQTEVGLRSAVCSSVLVVAVMDEGNWRENPWIVYYGNWSAIDRTPNSFFCSKSIFERHSKIMFWRLFVSAVTGLGEFGLRQSRNVFCV